MTNPHIHGKPSVYSASNAIDALAAALLEIKTADRLTYADLGAVLGKSEDQAAKYCDGSATMDVITFGRGRREWGSRFTGYFDRLCEKTFERDAEDRQCERDLLAAALVLSDALSDDGKVDPEEVRRHRAVLEKAHDALTCQLGKLRVRAA